MNLTIKHFQTRYSLDDGDCLRACIATLFQIPDQHALPDFRTGRWWDNARTWTRTHTNQRLDLSWTAPRWPTYTQPATHPVIAIVGSQAAAGSTHAVLADPNTGQLLHDPNRGIETDPHHPRFIIAPSTPTEADARHHLWTQPSLARWFPNPIDNVQLD